MFLVGVYEKEITPPLGFNIPGYFNARYAKGVKSRLYARAMVIPYFEFDGRKMTRLVMKPIELNFNECETLKGIPAEADEETAVKITEYLNEISAVYGTNMSYKNGLIEVKISEE